jgi:hypothetical protein
MHRMVCPLLQSYPCLRIIGGDEDPPFGDGINDITELFVVEEEVNELGDFKAIYCDNRLVAWSDNEIGLRCPFQQHLCETLATSKIATRLAYAPHIHSDEYNDTKG